MIDENELLVAEEHFDNEEYEEAFRLYKRLADNGSVDSQVFLGWMYQNGLGVEKDMDKSFSYYLSSAKLGSAAGQFHLAKSYARQKDFPKAMEWYLKASEKEYSPALFRLGWIHDTGRGVKQDKVKAFSYYSRAVDKGHIFAQKHLVLLLIKGHKGFLARFRGIVILLKCIVSVILVAAEDPHSERLRN